MKTIVLVLKSGGDFGFQDVNLIGTQILLKWKSSIKPKIVCFWDQIKETIDLGNIEYRPINNDYKGVWSRFMLYGPEVEDLKPFLYLDLDTAIIQSLENIFELVYEKEDKWIVLEDFWQKNQLATGLVWFPKNCKKTLEIYNKYVSDGKSYTGRMDYYLRTVSKEDLFWQQLTSTVYNFKPKNISGKYLVDLPKNANLVCFHGKPRIPQADFVPWVNKYLSVVK